MTNGSLMKVENIAECSKGSILQYFWLKKRYLVLKTQFLVVLRVTIYTGFAIYFK